MAGPESIARLGSVCSMVLGQGRIGHPADLRLIVVLEATGMSWFTVGQYFARHGVEVYRVNGQQVADLRRVYQRHAKSDRIDTRVLARLYLLHPERLHRLRIPNGQNMALQRACRERERLVKQCTASKNRLVATDKFAWIGLADIIPPYGERTFWVRSHWYNPWQVLEIGPQALTATWQKAFPHRDTEIAWITDLCRQAQLVVDLYGSPGLDYALLQEDVHREQLRFQDAHSQVHNLKINVLRPLYRQLHPQRYLETIQGVGQDSAAVYIAFIGDILRFPMLNRIYAVLRENRPYQLQDIDRKPVSKRKARQLCQEHFIVPDKVRRRNNQRVRRARLEQKTERRYQKRHNS